MKKMNAMKPGDVNVYESGKIIIFYFMFYDRKINNEIIAFKFGFYNINDPRTAYSGFNFFYKEVRYDITQLARD